MAIRRILLLLLRETQTITITATAIAILQLRNAQSVYIAAGASASGFIAKGLKRCIRQPRPIAATKQTYGMPSTHSASISFMGVYLALLACTTPPPGHVARLPMLTGSLLALTSLSIAASVCWSRIHLDYHTPLQVAAGAGLGGICALLAFACYPTELAAILERATEDALFVVLDAWRDRDPRYLRQLTDIYKTVL